MKKILSLVCAAAFVCIGFAGCSESSDNNNAAALFVMSQQNGSQVKVSEYAAYFGTYTGTMTVTMGGNTITKAVNYNVAETSLTDNSGSYGTYTKVLWFKDSDGKVVVAGQSDTTFNSKGALTTENAKTASSCYIVFNDNGTATYTVPAMAAMGGVAAITKQ